MLDTRRVRWFSLVSGLLCATVATASACGDDTTTQSPLDAGVKDARADDGSTSSLDGSSATDASDAATDAGIDANLVRQCTLSSSPVLVAKVGAPSSILSANDAFIYWAGGGGVIRLAKTGGAPQQVSTAIGSVVSASNTAVCFGLGIEAGTVCALPDGKSPIPVMSGYPNSLRLEGALLTYVNGTNGVVGQVQTDGGAPNPITAPGSLRVSAAPLGTYVVYGESAEVYAASRITPDASVLVSPAVAGGIVYEVVADGTEAYWSDRGVPSIRRTNGGIGGSAVTLVNAPYGAGLGHSYGHAVDSTYLYAAFRDGVGHGQIARVPKNGVDATATVLDDNLKEAIGIVVDDTCIYYYAERTTDAGTESGIYGLKK